MPISALTTRTMPNSPSAGRAEHEDQHEHRAEDRVEAGEDVGPDDLGERAARALARCRWSARARRAPRPRPRSSPSAGVSGRSASSGGVSAAGEGVTATASTLPSAAVDEHYPTAWESDVVLTDGGTVHLRPIRPDDDAGLLGLFARLSSESLYMRFFSPVSAPTAAQLEHFTDVDYDDRMALVAELGDDIVAVARYDRTPGRDRGRGRVHGAGRPAGPRARARSCSSTSPRSPARTASRASWPRRCPTTAACSACSATRASQVVREFADGVVHVHVPDRPDRGVAGGAGRARADLRGRARSRRLLAPRSIAVIGAGRRPGTIGHEVFRNLLAGELHRARLPGQPATRRRSRASARTRRSSTSPTRSTSRSSRVPAASVAEVVQRVRDEGRARARRDHRRVRRAAASARASSSELVELARRHGMRLVGPNCMGVVNTDPDVSMNATFAPFRPVRGHGSAFASQSGALGIELLGQAAEPRPRRLDVRVDGQQGRRQRQRPPAVLGSRPRDRRDPPVPRVVREPAQVRAARPPGRSQQADPRGEERAQPGRARGAAASHTAALGVVRRRDRRAVPPGRRDPRRHARRAASTPRRCSSHQPLPAGPPGRDRLATAAAPASSPPTRARARASRCPSSPPRPRPSCGRFVSPDASVGEPGRPHRVGDRGDRTSARCAPCSPTPSIDAVLVIFVPPLVTDSDDVARAIVAAASRRRARSRSSRASSTQANAPEILQAAGDDRRPIPCFTFPEAAAVALGRAAEPRRVAPPARGRRCPTSPAIDRAARARDRRPTRSPTTRRTCGSTPDGRDRPVPAASGSRSRRCATPTRPTRPSAAAEALGFPVALKAGAGAIVHKTDVGGVRARPRRRRRGARRVRRRWRPRSATTLGGVVVQPMVAAGHRDDRRRHPGPELRPARALRHGRRRRRAASATPRCGSSRSPTSTPRELVRSLRSSPLLFGYRGAPPADVAALEDLLLRVGLLADEIPEVARARLQPGRRLARRRGRHRHQDPPRPRAPGTAPGPPPAALTSAGSSGLGDRRVASSGPRTCR